MGRLTAAVITCFALLCAPAAAQQGTPLENAEADLAQALVCQDQAKAKGADVALLVPGTTLTPEEFDWNYLPALTKAGIPWCTVEPPGRMMDDIQNSAEFVTYAIRTIHAQTGKKVDVIGHSQGGMVPRWSLKYWPDTRGMVDDLVGLAPSNHGTTLARGVCAADSCAASIWQQRDDSAFIGALNAGGETFKGISYTAVYSDNDEVVTPNNGPNPSSALRTGDGAIGNVRIQDVCPLSTAEHLTTGTSDPVGYAAAIDALTHDGPARTDRIDRAVCAQVFMPGVDPAMSLGKIAELGDGVLRGLSTGPQLDAEPALRCYVTARCTGTIATPRCVVPKLKGLRRGKARAAILTAGCSMGKVTGRKRGKVVKQSPRAGAQRTSGARVRIRLR